MVSGLIAAQIGRQSTLYLAARTSRRWPSGWASWLSARMQQLLDATEMRAIFGVLSLLLVLGVVAWLAKTQLTSTRQAMPSLAAPGGNLSSVPASVPVTNVREQSQQMQQQIKQSVEAAMRQARPLPDDR